MPHTKLDEEKRERTVHLLTGDLLMMSEYSHGKGQSVSSHHNFSLSVREVNKDNRVFVTEVDTACQYLNDHFTENRTRVKQD